ncbi:hypothetical protein PLICBS_006629 [Purpureocillium lilacinum]|uniref:uncharacterized protein n=1 Tax=Purpureocillium lilacinum TaxID=33203 RepID=UPI00207EF8FE|nr:hypothetical protein PLICBS_006629 [Purpureocillium lilacinum]
MKTPFSIAANPDTDVWKKPPTHDVFNAPYLTHSRQPTTAFRSASLTFTSPYATQFDQAGLLLVFHPPSSHLPFPANNIKSPTDVPAHRKWIKAGVEFFDGAPRLSTVCCDNWADWSVASLPTTTTTTTTTPSSADADQALAEIVAGTRPVTITIAKETSSNGSCLWVHYVDPATGAKTPMREINWPYGEPAGPGWELEVAAAVARPAKSTTDKLEATFTEFDVKWA